MDVLNKIIIKTKSYREKAQASSVFDNLFAYEKKKRQRCKTCIKFFFRIGISWRVTACAFFTLSC